jgi:pyruvate/2-oxoglutarate/acetoin dehydrogenase E1 component
MANILNEEHKIECDIIYFNTIRPFDPKIFIKSISKTKKFICIEELSKSGGLYEDCLKSSLEIFNEKINSVTFVH